MDNLPANFGKRIGSIDELPDELRRHLQLADMGEFEQLLTTVLRDDLQGFANLNELLVGLYRRSGEVYARTFVSNKLYRMMKAGYVVPIKGKKGAYMLPPLA